MGKKEAEETGDRSRLRAAFCGRSDSSTAKKLLDIGSACDSRKDKQTEHFEPLQMGSGTAPPR